MTLITKNNYEAYMLDYVEEKLSPELTNELMLFLENNPEIKMEIEKSEIHRLQPQELNLVDKLSLKKGSIPSINYYEELIILEIEGLNKEKASDDLHSILDKNPDKQSDFIAFQKTKLIGGSVIFENKKSLKRNEGKVIPMYWWYTSAAAVVIVLVFLNVFKSDEKSKNLPIAKVKKEATSPLQEIISNSNESNNNEIVIAEVTEQLNSSVAISKQKIKKQTGPIVHVKKLDKVIAITNISTENIEPNKDAEVQDLIQELPSEEIQYANNVKITYQDGFDESDDKPKSLIRAVGQFITKPLKKRIITQEKDASGEVVAYAVNIAGIKFSRNKRKK